MNGITRNRTQLFVRFRESARGSARRSQNRELSKNVEIQLKNMGSQPQTTKLLQEVEPTSGDNPVVVTLPPQWVSTVDQISVQMDTIKHKIQQLKQLHKAHLLVEVGEEITDDVHIIEISTAEITQLLGDAQGKVKNLGKGQLIGASSDHVKMLHNVQGALASQLQDLTTSFRQSQQHYLTKLRARAQKFQDPFVAGATNSFNPDEADLNLEDFEDKGFTDEQMSALAYAETDAAQRLRDIRQIAKSVVELAEIVKDLSLLVVEQGTILDRIDYNIEQTAVSTEKAVEELEKASKIQSKTKTKLCILLLMGLLLAAGAGLVVKMLLK